MATFGSGGDQDIHFLLDEALGLQNGRFDSTLGNLDKPFSKEILMKLLKLFESNPILSEDGQILRILCTDNGVVTRLFDDLSVLTHQSGKL